MNFPKEDEFNIKFRHLLDRFVLNKSNLKLTYRPNDVDSCFVNNIFVSIEDRNRNLCSLTNLRLIILANFISNFLGIKLKLNVCSEKTNDLKRFKSILELINIKENLTLEFHSQHTDMEEIAKKFVQNIDEKFKTTDKENDVIVNFSRIKSEFNLEKYDQNLKNKYLDVLPLTAELYKNFLNENLPVYDGIQTLCLNSELFQAQKIDLLLRSFSDIDHKHKRYEHGFICTGIVKIDENEPSYFDLRDDFLKHYECRQKFFKYSAEQRQMMSEQICEVNIQNLTLFSLVYDMFNSNHQTDIKKFKCIDLEKIKIDENQKLGEQSSFILYNCARISAILDKFYSNVDQGLFEKLKNTDDLDFYNLLKTNYERKICSNFLFKCESIFDEIYQSLTISGKNSVQIRINISKLLCFTNDLFNHFSKYYSKIRIIE
ncbi:DALR anticodon-binding domain-containing, partial [Brachionus plicatilis]